MWIRAGSGRLAEDSDSGKVEFYSWQSKSTLDGNKKEAPASKQELLAMLFEYLQCQQYGNDDSDKDV